MGLSKENTRQMESLKICVERRKQGIGIYVRRIIRKQKSQEKRQEENINVANEVMHKKGSPKNRIYKSKIKVLFTFLNINGYS